MRAVRLLGECDIIISEDSRQTRKLMTLLKIENKPKFVDFTRNHLFNIKGVDEVLSKLGELNEKELKVLLVTDAGTPGISDPGVEIIRLARSKNIEFTVLPGPTAFVPAIVASGMASKEFEFKGFLPIKKGRQTSWQYIIRSQNVLIIYESVHRIKKFIQEAKMLEDEREICICREISKAFESVWVGKVNELKNYPLVEKGEFVIVIGPNTIKKIAVI
jgi:16S rRNA (cytidine1402-2'-O)-methyltransferase